MTGGGFTLCSSMMLILRLLAELGSSFTSGSRSARPVTLVIRLLSRPNASSVRRVALARSLEELVVNVEKQVALAGIRQGKSRPTLNVS